ncbi:conserved hypothetical protein [Theileria equi strain WA]|uniref:ATP-dependent helicase C-terminal domain-containing protein n=1 Tax=Theileria equi strain WA TaxID=1537102 RepID=L1LDT5_THEEQ|nr:conserved hypothetical protein [Theileria equi strain WA]EKX73303.1 conserved hypothetical protein [Theileria equi strain WA]|eukprot:XP_004832755.1 conserved hypothetical protein [Theileria equi strain WA]
MENDFTHEAFVNFPPLYTEQTQQFVGHGSVFDEYSKTALERGAILFGVFGGRQSEGVNFSDGLARLVLLVGLPYPPDSIKLALKRQDTGNHSGPPHLDRTLLCYKNVNQCIGRAMRHRMDFAAVLLLDSRYRGKDAKYLSGYVQESLRQRAVGDLESALESFYRTFHDD